MSPVNESIHSTLPLVQVKLDIRYKLLSFLPDNGWCGIPATHMGEYIYVTACITTLAQFQIVSILLGVHVLQPALDPKTLECIGNIVLNVI